MQHIAQASRFEKSDSCPATISSAKISPAGCGDDANESYAAFREFGLSRRLVPFDDLDFISATRSRLCLRTFSCLAWPSAADLSEGAGFAPCFGASALSGAGWE